MNWYINISIVLYIIVFVMMSCACTYKEWCAGRRLRVPVYTQSVEFTNLLYRTIFEMSISRISSAPSALSLGISRLTSFLLTTVSTA